MSFTTIYDSRSALLFLDSCQQEETRDAIKELKSRLNRALLNSKHEEARELASAIRVLAWAAKREDKP